MIVGEEPSNVGGSSGSTFLRLLRAVGTTPTKAAMQKNPGQITDEFELALPQTCTPVIEP